MNQQANRIAWITGGGTGIGRATALQLARDGWQVAISGRRREPLDEVKEAARELAGEILPVPADVTVREDMQAAVREIEAQWGHVYLCILNAGTFTPFNAAKEFSTETFEQHYAVNFFGVIHGIEAVLPAMRELQTGHIVLVSSASGYRGLPLAAPYGSSKAALINLAESLHFDLEPLGIKTSVVTPGFVETPLTDQNRFKMPAIISTQKAADALCRGIARGSFEITFPRRFTYTLKLARILPYRLFFPLMRWFTGR